MSIYSTPVECLFEWEDIQFMYSVSWVLCVVFVVVKKERFECEKGENSLFIYPFMWYKLHSLLQDLVHYKQQL